jgi:DNA gyrase/topoisomerase IV subunit B
MKQIEVLTDYEHVRLRPGMYVGSVAKSDERILLLEGDPAKLRYKTVQIPVGMYRLFDEILDNAIDEHNRETAAGLKGLEITVQFNETTNEITVSDTGLGFVNGMHINPKSGKTNIESAFSMPRAGSNFRNTDTDASVSGMNGIGAAAVNMLSQRFEVTTRITDTQSIHWLWTNFQPQHSVTDPVIGTQVKFIPDPEIFGSVKYDKQVLLSRIALRAFTSNHGVSASDPQKLTLRFFTKREGKEAKETPLPDNIFPDQRFQLATKRGTIVVWENTQGVSSFSMINGCLCTGIHQKIVQECLNGLLGYEKAHDFYDFFVSMQVPPTLMRFGDQSKTKFSSSRNEITPIFEKDLQRRIESGFVQSPVFDSVIERIQEKLQQEELKKLKQAKKNSKTRISDKYFPPSGNHERLLICEGLSSLGNLIRKRNPKTDGAYGLKGKIKKVRTLSELTGNTEIVDIINILNLEWGNPEQKCKYEKVIIATDFDPDGAGHICSLIINFFAKWFPKVIEEGRLYHLQTPLIGCTTESRTKKHYFYSQSDFERFKTKHSVKETFYYKGLGSYNSDDLSFIFDQMLLHRINFDQNSNRMLEIAFGNDAKKRKKWLEINI